MFCSFFADGTAAGTVAAALGARPALLWLLTAVAVSRLVSGAQLVERSAGRWPSRCPVAFQSSSCLSQGVLVQAVDAEEALGDPHSASVWTQWRGADRHGAEPLLPADGGRGRPGLRLQSR